MLCKSTQLQLNVRDRESLQKYNYEQHVPDVTGQEGRKLIIICVYFIRFISKVIGYDKCSGVNKIQYFCGSKVLEKQLKYVLKGEVRMI